MKSAELPGFLQVVAPFLSNYGLAAVGVLVFLEDFGVPVPGETILIAAAIYAGAGRLNIVAVGVVGFIAAVIGDNVGYLIGRQGGRRLALRYGRYVFLTSERLDKAEAFVDRHGGKVITIARFIEGLRQANGLIAGITRMRWLRFLAWNALGAALWVGVWVSIGYFAGSHITAIYGQFQRYVLYVVVAAIVIIVALILWHLRRYWQPWLRRHRDEGGHGDGAGGDGRDGASEAVGARKPDEAAGARKARGDVAAHKASEANGVREISMPDEASGARTESETHHADDTDGAERAGIADGIREAGDQRSGGDHGSEAARGQHSERAPDRPGGRERP